MVTRCTTRLSFYKQSYIKPMLKLLRIKPHVLQPSPYDWSILQSPLFVLTLASDRAALNGYDALLILMVSTKKWYSSFLKNIFVFQKIYFEVKVLLKTFETFIDCDLRTCRSLKWRAILKIPRIIFRRIYCSFFWL